MEEKRKNIEELVRLLNSKVNRSVKEEQIQSIVDKLKSMNSKEVIDYIALNIDSFLGGSVEPEIFDACIEALLEFDKESYNTKEEIIEQIRINKATNYTPGAISVEENHKLIEDTLRIVCDRLNKLGVDYYLVGALSAFIATETPLFRYHEDIDFLVAEKDIEKVREALDGTDYIFEDNRLNNKKIFKEELNYTQGEHEVIANHKDNEFHLGFFLFRREKDKTLIIREYFMQENKKGERVPKVLEKIYSPEFVELEYTEKETQFAGTKFRTATPECVYVKKMYTKNPKDLSDIEVLDSKIDKEKLEKRKKQQNPALRITSPDIKEHLDENQTQLSFGQKVAKKLASSKFLKRLPFIRRFIEKQFELLPEQTKTDSSSEKRKKFENMLSDDGAHKGIVLECDENSISYTQQRGDIGKEK